MVSIGGGERFSYPSVPGMGSRMSSMWGPGRCSLPPQSWARGSHQNRWPSEPRTGHSDVPLAPRRMCWGHEHPDQRRGGPQSRLTGDSVTPEQRPRTEGRVSIKMWVVTP